VQEREALAWTGVEVFADFRQGSVGEVLGQQGQQCTSEQGQIGKEVGVARAGTVLALDGIAAPVVADFHAGPVTRDEGLPLFRAIGVVRYAGKVVTGLGGGLGGFLDGEVTAYDHQGACRGEVGRQGFDGEGVDAADLNASVTGSGLEEKGVLGKASRPWAWRKRFG
jgi:hypothetical protein